MENSDHQKALKLLETAQAALEGARALLGDAPKTSGPSFATSSSYQEKEIEIVEGVFDGQNMLGPEGKKYPVPANYASKSKLVEGDQLKLSIQLDGSFRYKQIAPVDRKFFKGTLTQEDGQYRVIAEGKSYRVLLASITYYKAQVGDDVTLIIPAEKEATWGTLEAVL